MRYLFKVNVILNKMYIFICLKVISRFKNIPSEPHLIDFNNYSNPRKILFINLLILLRADKIEITLMTLN